MYPQEEIEQFISRNFVPVKIHLKEQPEVFKRFNAQWTPILAILDSEGAERYRFEGYLPADEFLPQLELGLAHAAFARSDWKDAEQRYRRIVERSPASDAAPEALYWAGVAKYKGSGDATALAETARRFRERYPQSIWAKKASVWAS